MRSIVKLFLYEFDFVRCPNSIHVDMYIYIPDLQKDWVQMSSIEIQFH